MVTGIETLKPRQIHELSGMGKRLDGIYRFTKIKHDLNPGSIYSAEFVAHKVLSEKIARRKATTKVRKRTGNVIRGKLPPEKEGS